jgi:hypothetical protein
VWLDANVLSMARLLEPLEDRLGATRPGAFAAPIKLAAGVLLGAEVGALGGFLGRRSWASTTSRCSTRR